MIFEDRLNKNFQETVMKMLKYLILWAPDNPRGKIIYILSVAIFVYMIVPAFCTLQVIYVVKERSDIDKVIRTLTICLFQCVALYKITVWYIDRARVKICVDLLNRKSFNFDVYEDINIDLKKVHLLSFTSNHFHCDNLQPELHFEEMEEFWNKNKILLIKNEQKMICNSESIIMVHKTLMKQGNIYSTGFVYYIWYMTFVTIFFLFQDSMWKSTWEMYSGKVIDEHRLAVNIYLPLDLNDTRVYAYGSYVVTTISIILSSQYIGKLFQ